MSNLSKVLAEGGVIIGVDVDTQNDFAKIGGALFVEADADVSPHLRELTRNLKHRIGSVDHHGPDAWEFKENGGPFPAHCLKGTVGARKIDETLVMDKNKNYPMRFVPMASEGHAMVGEAVKGAGPRIYTPEMFVREVLQNGWAAIFEKEVYSMFSNANADSMIKALVEAVGGTRKAYFAVYGYCTGGYCVDEAAKGLIERGYNTGIVLDATAPIGGEEGETKTISMAHEKGIEILMTDGLLNSMGKKPTQTDLPY